VGRNPPPQKTMLTMETTMQLCPSLQRDLQGYKFILGEGFDEYVDGCMDLVK
jgi:hypothetical protein